MDLNGPTRTRSNHDFKNRPRAARTNYFKFSFFNRYVNDNSLVHNSPSSLNCFKTRLFNYFLTSHILLFLTVFGFFSFFVSYLSSSSSFFFFLHNVQLYTVLRHSLLIVLSFSFAGRAVFISEFNFPLLLSFTYCAFI